MPGSGDSVQALKAGIMEIPDVIAVNKMDHPAAKTMVNEVRSILTLDQERAWRPPIVLPRPRAARTSTCCGRRSGASRLPRDEGRSRSGGGGTSRRGVRCRVVACEGASRARGRGRSRAAATARRGAAPRARPLDGGARDHGEGVSVGDKRPRRFVTSEARERLSGIARVTPVYGSETLSRLAGRTSG